ncbi:FKBP-type peptidyl-prolyl cis-trans isomerase [Rubrivirga sp. IMCC43871]|uniref:FKBP-type peptidyl-prolyl cis-trans isomerase n=1 Tax=Rubrivirga sp. IMCC43871 TaxID=3391575 RepID=UPI00398F940C
MSPILSGRTALPLLLGLLLTTAACDSGESGVVEASSTVTIDYVGRLADGTVFDQNPSYTGRVSEFVIGFRLRILGMVTGETRTFDIPPEEAYGSEPVRNPAGVVIIPGNSTLTFEVTVLDIQ